jgi:3-deoxy-D-manno-octulosonic-acid transferase
LLPLPYYLYATATAVAAPLIRRGIRRKMAAAGDEVRLSERLGRAPRPRPKGRLIWMHAVSVGELLSILGLIQSLKEQAPDLQVLVNTTTSTSAALAAKRLPEGAIHQFSPLDTPRAVRRFFNHWQPDLAVFVESEIWPRQIVEAHRRGIPLALIQARLSRKSLDRWEKFPRTARALLTRFSLVLCQIEATRSAVISLGQSSDRTLTSGDLKASSDPLPVDAEELARLRQTIGDRPLWLAASTHPGEEEQVAEAHGIFKEKHHDGVLILAPRHPERGDDIAHMLRNDGWDVAQRQHHDEINALTEIYVADTLGEMGLWYALAQITYVAGSFTDVGGHNPYEAAHFDSAILHGPLFANAAQIYDDMDSDGAALKVQDAEALGAALLDLTVSSKAQTLQKKAHDFATSARNIRDDVAGRLLALLP